MKTNDTEKVPNPWKIQIFPIQQTTNRVELLSNVYSFFFIIDLVKWGVFFFCCHLFSYLLLFYIYRLFQFDVKLKIIITFNPLLFYSHPSIQMNDFCICKNFLSSCGYKRFSSTSVLVKNNNNWIVYCIYLHLLWAIKGIIILTTNETCSVWQRQNYWDVCTHAIINKDYYYLLLPINYLLLYMRTMTMM